MCQTVTTQKFNYLQMSVQFTYCSILPLSILVQAYVQLLVWSLVCKLYSLVSSLVFKSSLYLSLKARLWCLAFSLQSSTTLQFLVSCLWLVSSLVPSLDTCRISSLFSRLVSILVYSLVSSLFYSLVSSFVPGQVSSPQSLVTSRVYSRVYSPVQSSLVSSLPSTQISPQAQVNSVSLVQSQDNHLVSTSLFN